MKKFILIPDSFKGTLSSIEVCDIIECEIKKVYNDAVVIKIPVADGGEGTVDAFLKVAIGKKIYVNVSNPYFEQIETFYGLIEDGKTAIIEMASCCGLPLIENNLNPEKTSTYGVGNLIIDALDKGASKIIIGLGGSCTNDGGAGCLSALGVKFFNKNNKEFIPVGGTLKDINKIDVTSLDNRLESVEIIVMCDVENPLYGKEGAAYIFAPQKGADLKMVEFLDFNLREYAKVINKDLGFNKWDFHGAGAAGGMGFGLKAVLSSQIKMGIDTILDIVNFDNIIKDADYIITGEGKLDIQSLKGKVVIGVARRARKQNKKVIAFVGNCCEFGNKVLEEGVSEIIEINYKKLPFEVVKKSAKEDMIEVVSKYINKLR